MVRLLQMGARIPPGSYLEIFSSHPKAVNFIYNNIVLSICNRELAPGGFRIVLDTDDVSWVQNFAFYDAQLQINGKKWDIPPAGHYRNPALGASAKGDLNKNLRESCAVFKMAAPPGSVESIISADIEQLGAFDLALRASYRNGLEYLRQGSYQKAARCFKGKGYGLTPGGDDFLTGFLLAMAYWAKKAKKDLSEILDMLLIESLSENHLSNTFLIQAHALEPNKDWADFLLALESERHDPLVAMNRVANSGKTSGYDTLSGFFAAWEMI